MHPQSDLHAVHTILKHARAHTHTHTTDTNRQTDRQIDTDTDTYMGLNNYSTSDTDYIITNYRGLHNQIIHTHLYSFSINTGRN